MSLPGVSEEPHFEKASFRVSGKIFATLPPDGQHVHLFLDDLEVEALVAEAPSTFEKLFWGKRLIGVRVKLSAADADLLRDLLEDAWRRKAPKRIVATFDSGPGGTR